jgi:hypothetical protein
VESAELVAPPGSPSLTKIRVNAGFLGGFLERREREDWLEEGVEFELSGDSPNLFPTAIFLQRIHIPTKRPKERKTKGLDGSYMDRSRAQDLWETSEQRCSRLRSYIRPLVWA